MSKPSKNRAVVLTANRQLAVYSRPMPKLGPTEVLIKVKGCGICASDIPRAFGGSAYHYPLVMGHEFAGEVVGLGTEAMPGLLGRIATVFPLIPCFQCPQCQRKAYGQCSDYSYYGSRTDGAYAKYVAVRAWNVLPLPHGVSAIDGALTEPVAVAIHGLSHLHLNVTQEDQNSAKEGIQKRLIVIGAGLIGLVCMEIVRRLNPSIAIAVADRNIYKLEKITDQNVEKLFIPDESDREQFLTDWSGQFDIVIEATGSASIFRESIRLAKPGGQVLWMGNIDAALSLPQVLVSSILRKEISIFGTWNSTYDGLSESDWTQALRLFAEGFAPSKYISDFVSLEQAPELLRNICSHKSGASKNCIFKAMILPHDESR